MAKDERQIIGSVRLPKGKGLFKAGQEDELQKAASSKEIKSLSERGIISGFGTSKTEETPDEVDSEVSDDLEIEEEEITAKPKAKKRK